MARKIISGKSVQVRGLRELEAKIRDLIDTSKGPEAQRVVGEAAKLARAEVVNHAMIARVPHEVLDDVFSYDRPHPSDKSRGRITGLVGIRKRGRSRPYAKAYKEWHARESWVGVAGRAASGLGGSLTDRGAKLIRGGLASGKLIGESLATMWELGTSKRPATPFFRPAITSARGQVVDALAAGYRAIIARHAR